MSLLSQKEVKEYLEIAERVPAQQRKKVLQLLELDRVERCRESFLFFVQQMWPVFISGKHHKIMADAFERVANGELKRLIINMPPRHAIVTGMKIPTTQGFKTIASLNVGDKVFGPDGRPVKVLGKSEVFKNRELYKVTTDDGASLVVDGEHLWTVRLDRKHGIYHDYTTEELWRRQNGEVLRTKRSGQKEFIAGKRAKTVRLPRLPDVQPVAYTRKELPIDPYVLGVWLGDGSSSSGVITSGDDDAVVVRAEIEKRGFKTTDQATAQTFGTLGLQVKLKELGVLGNKHIPEVYLQADEQQRRDLLKGLMDTDGNVTKAGQCFFAQSNRSFIESVCQLIHSLGIKASIIESEAKIKDKSYGKTWKISFYANDIFMLPRKEARTLKDSRTFGRYISIEKLNQVGDTQCIKVDREDGLFLAGEGYIVTHNTKSEFASYLLPAWFLGKFPEKKIIQVAHTAELAVGFGRKVRNVVSSDAYQKVFDTKLSSDSKAAGRWNTQKGGDYFAIGVGGAVTGKGADLCVDLLSTVYTPSGEKKAKDVVVGDLLLGVGGYGRVRHVIRSQHDQTVVINGDLKVSAYHPVFTGRGWVDAKDLLPTDVLFTPSCLMYNSYSTHNGVDDEQLLKGIQHLGDDAPALLQPKGSKLSWLRSKRDKGVRALEQVFQLYCRPWPRSFSSAHAGQDRQQRGLHAGELPLGGRFAAAKQPSQLSIYRSLWQAVNACTVGARNWIKQRHHQASNLCYEHAAGAGFRHERKDVSQSKTCETVHPDRGTGQRILKLGRSLYQNQDQQGSDLQQPIRQEQNLRWIPVEIRSIRIEHHEPKEFVNFHVEGSNTFVCNTYLTHNCIIDDPHSEQEARQGNPEVYDSVYEWYTSGPRQRLQPGGSIIIVQTRWSKRDLTGQVLKNSSKDGTDNWEVIEFPAILPSGTPLWPGFWKKEELEAIKAELPVAKWEAQYQQNPTSEEGAIIKREQWRLWEDEDPPECEYVIQSWDTAFEKSNRADFSACTTWGIFQKENEKGYMQPNIIMLDAVKERLEFPELKKKAFDMWKEWNPDTLIIEKRAAGAPLVYELRRMGIPLSEYTPYKGQDKIARVNSIADLFASGVVWRPDTRWAEEVVEEMASFPNGDHDDLVDSTSQALMRFRQGGFITVQSDEQDEPSYFRRKVEYY